MKLKDLDRLAKYRDFLSKSRIDARPKRDVRIEIIDLPDFETHLNEYCQDYKVFSKARRKMDVFGISFGNLSKLKFTQPCFWGLLEGRLNYNYITRRADIRVFSYEEAKKIGQYINRMLLQNPKLTRKSVIKRADAINKILND